ncbi:MAG: cache domain-containing protein [Pseudomonadota bacterium]
MRMGIKTKLLILQGLTIIFCIFSIGYVSYSSIENAGENTKNLSSIALLNQAESTLMELTSSMAQQNDIIFSNIKTDTIKLSYYVKKVYENPSLFLNYYNTDERMVVGDGNQYMNSKEDTASIFVPNTVVITKGVKQHIALAANMDFVFPAIKGNDNNIVAVWTIRDDGITYYYPNIELGKISPPDYDPRNDIFYLPATPEHNPERKEYWSDVYNDPAGQGLMITAVSPVYLDNGRFKGVVGVDVTLNNIMNRIEIYSPFEHAYSFIIDKKGKLLATSDQAYQIIFGEKKDETKTGFDFAGSNPQFEKVIEKMINDPRGFEKISLNKKEYYIAYSKLESTGWRIGVITKADTLLRLSNQIQGEIEKSTNDLLYKKVIPISIFIFVVITVLSYAFAVSITKPLIELTVMGNKIADGDINVEPAHIKTKDEIEDLANTINMMVGAIKYLKKENL